MRAATDIVLFGCRLILLENECLFACQKRMVEQTLPCKDLPDHFAARLETFLQAMSDEAMQAFCQMIIDFRIWPQGDHLSRFLQDVELT